VSSTSTELVCEAPLNMGQSIMGQLLMGNSYSMPPRRFFRFNVAEVNGISRVQSSGWMELQMAFGQTRRTDFSGPEFQNSIFDFMGAAGGKFPVGTTFPNHVVMGFESQRIMLDGYLAMKVTSVSSAYPAEKAGLQVGDLVTKIAGKRFKNSGGFYDAIAKAAESATYPIEVSRNGKSLTLTLERALRPTWTEQVVAEQETGAIAVQTAFSVADELSKLAKLRDNGTITEADFQSQKKKLLGQ
jgi:membrane-associated protease RseP (regulator of RpoE activity)